MKRIVLVTGSGRRIGRALAIGFARRGFDVAVHYGHDRAGAERTVREIQDLGASGSMFQADVRDREGVRRMVFDAADAFGGLDVLVNNAGVYPPQAKVPEIAEEAWRSVLETNLYGEFFAAQAAAEVMLERGAGAPEGEEVGRIVNLSSLGAFQIWKDRIPYNVSKAAIVQLTRALARALAPRIAVNSVAPGAIAIPEDPAPGAMIPASRIPMKRHGSTDDIFAAVWFFAVEARYVTGQTLIVDGGLNVAQESSQD